jgi:anti-anti-sigma factor
MTSGNLTTRAQEINFRCETLDDGAGVVAAAGYMNAECGRRIADSVRMLFDRGCRLILIDLDGTRLVNHNGLHVLRELRDEVARRGGRLGFCNLTATVAATFRIAGLLPA